MSKAMDNPKVKLMIEDGDAYAGRMKNYFDVIIVDSSDPIGPADVLFQEPFYSKCYEALREGGILACQGALESRIVMRFLSLMLLLNYQANACGFIFQQLPNPWGI